MPRHFISSVRGYKDGVYWNYQGHKRNVMVMRSGRTIAIGPGIQSSRSSTADEESPVEDFEDVPGSWSHCGLYRDNRIVKYKPMCCLSIVTRSILASRGIPLNFFQNDVDREPWLVESPFVYSKPRENYKKSPKVIEAPCDINHNIIEEEVIDQEIDVEEIDDPDDDDDDVEHQLYAESTEDYYDNCLDDILNSYPSTGVKPTSIKARISVSRFNIATNRALARIRVTEDRKISPLARHTEDLQGTSRMFGEALLSEKNVSSESSGAQGSSSQSIAETNHQTIAAPTTISTQTFVIEECDPSSLEPTTKAEKTTTTFTPVNQTQLITSEKTSVQLPVRLPVFYTEDKNLTFQPLHSVIPKKIILKREGSDIFSTIEVKKKPKTVVVEETAGSAATPSGYASCSTESQEERPVNEDEDPDKALDLTESQLQCHSYITDANGNRVHRCKACEKVFTVFSAFKSHTSVHSRQRNRCPTCGKVFTRSWLLKGHIRTHTGERPYLCSHNGCDKSFADKSNLRSHMLIHTVKEKKYVCHKCGRGFAQKRYLHKHRQEVCKT